MGKGETEMHNLPLSRPRRLQGFGLQDEIYNGKISKQKIGACNFEIVDILSYLVPKGNNFVSLQVFLVDLGC